MKIKRILSAISALVIASTLTASYSNVLAAEKSQIFLDTFETGFNGWAARGDSTAIEIVDNTSYAGEKSLYVTGRTQNWNGAACAKIKELRAGKSYDFSVWVMQDEGSASEQMALQMMYTDSQGQEQYSYIAGGQVKNGEWTQIKRENFTIPQDATNVVIYVEATNLINFYVDDVQAMGEAITDEEVVEGYKDDFESGAMGWAGRGDAKTEVVTTYSNTGKSSLYTTNRVQLWNGPASNKTMVLNAGTTYHFSGWVMYNEEQWTDSHKFSINIQFQHDGKENYVEIASATAKKGEWTKIEGNYTIPTGATNFSIYSQTGYVPDAQVTPQDLMNFYIDDMVCEKLPDPKIQTDIASLKEVFSDYFTIGCSVEGYELDVPATQDLVLKHFGSLTTGNELKPDYTLNQSASAKLAQETGDQTNPQVSLARAKSLLDFCVKNNIPLRGHTLVWHSQTPDWFFKENFDPAGNWVSKEIMTKRLENYIKNIMEALKTQYPDLDVYAWDVVNEAVTDSGEMRVPGSNNTVTGQSAWTQIYGDNSFVNLAFEFARKYAPADCKLFYNDYNEYVPEKRDAIIAKVKEIQAAGNIDGIGLQSHIKLNYPSLAVYEEAINKYSETGLELHITELDIDQPDNSDKGMAELAQRYREVFEMYKRLDDEGANITDVIIWGLIDGRSWIGGYPLLFDPYYQAKVAFHAIVDPEMEIEIPQAAIALSESETLEHAFEVQNALTLGSGNFKVSWSTNGLTFRVSANNQKVTLVSNGSNLFSDTINGTKDIFVPLTELGLASLEEGTVVPVNIQIGSIWWNTVKKDVGYSDGTIALKAVPNSTEAIYGTPIIDGEIDAAWTKANEIQTTGSGATAKVKTMWDKDYIYVLAEVTDSILNNTHQDPWEQDSVEIFLDENNAKTPFYQADDGQFRTNFENGKSTSSNKTSDSYKSAATILPTGSVKYLIEFAIPNTTGAYSQNQVLGFDVQVNDADSSGTRVNTSNWNDFTGAGWTSTSDYGVLKLVSDTPITAEKYGDLNGDGKIDNADLLVICQYLVREIDLTSSQLKLADVSGDGVVEISDAAILKQAVLGDNIKLSK